MALDKENFFIKMIIFNNKEIKTVDITDKINGFTNSNSAQILGQDNIKYKIMFDKLDTIDNFDDGNILFQLSIKFKNKFYNPLIFLPININCTNNLQEGLGRAISYRIHNNKFEHLWFYLSHTFVEEILNNTSDNKISNDEEYIKKVNSLIL